MPSYAFPPPPPTIEPTAIDELDRIVGHLAGHKTEWIAVPIPERLAILGELKERLLDLAHEWVDAGTRAKGLPAGEAPAGEEWLGGPGVTMRNIRLLEGALREVEAHGEPQVDPRHLSERPDGRLVVQAFPGDLVDKLLYSGFTAEIWMQPGVTRDNLADTMAVHYKHRDPKGTLALVLGAGNVSSIPPMDALYKLFVENEIVLLKMNPVNEYLGPIFRRLFAPLVGRGFFEVVYGGVEQGAHLANHPRIDAIHITGSDATHDAIVWGPAEERAERKATGEPVNRKPITSELGNVTPVIVVPGPWTEAEIQFQAENVATMVANNASFNCNAAKLLVTPAEWDLREKFLARVRAVLAELPSRKAYYPGTETRWKAFLEAHPDALQLSEPAERTVPWTWIGGLDPEADDEICFTREPFCGVLHEVALPGRAAVEFLPRAVEFCNDRVWGTLACMMLVHPATRKDPASEATFQEALDDLRYGGIAVNTWAGLNYGFGVLTWGAYPGHPLEDIQSGRGVVHNTLMFDKPEKSIVYAPFTSFPKPPWFVTHGRSHRIGPKIVRMEAGPSLLKVPGIAIQAALG